MSFKKKESIIGQIGEGLHRLQHDAAVHLVEQFSWFSAVLDDRVVLPVGAQADALAQLRRRGQMIDPRRIDLPEQD